MEDLIILIERKDDMKTLEDKRLYTRYERFKAGEIIFDYIFENCIPTYDELLINKYKDYSIYVYTIKDISIKILLDNESKILYDLSYKNKSEMVICGNGAASKEQVALMVERTLGINIDSKYLDATDALAIAMCHYYELKSPLTAAGKGASSWEKFISQNPGRVK